MRWLGIVLVASLGACYAKPPEPLENAPRAAEEPQVQHVALVKTHAPRPAIDLAPFLPDFHEELRWPLSGMNHPVLEPRYPVAQELAIGVDWQTLCVRGVQNRTSGTQKELLSYLRGWCDVQKHDVDSACRNLTPLMGAMTRGMTAAVRQDLANIIVDSGDADKAEHWLSKHNIRDIELLDILAANYIEVGSEADASTINSRAMDSDSRATTATVCRRLVKRIVLGHDAGVLTTLQQLKALGTPTAKPAADPLCEKLYNKVACAREPVTKCLRFFTDENIDAHALHLLDAYYNWPFDADYQHWWLIGDEAARALPVPGAAELAITAYEASVAAGPKCRTERAAAIHLAIQQIRAAPEHEAYEPRLQRLAEQCPWSPPPPPPPKPTPAPGGGNTPGVPSTP